jgi:hypothetical protein
MINENPTGSSLLNERRLERLWGFVLVARLLYPFFNSPLDHLFSDPQRHWENGQKFLDPGIMGSSDPYLYQVWIFLLQHLARGSTPTILLGCGFLCAMMPYGWYRALRELLPKSRALWGALLIGLIPESVSLYAYFMNETLLLSLLGFCFWSTLRSHRKKTLTAFALASVLWTGAAFTRTVAVPMAAGCLLWLWATQAQRFNKAAVAVALVVLAGVPAGLHGKAKLGYFAPLGNLYFNEIYSVSGAREIAVDYGPDGSYHFGCPSFYNPTFYPWSDWTTDRTGVVSIAVDLTRGRSGWTAEKARVEHQPLFPAWRRRKEDLLYLLFGQSWPNSDRASVAGWLTVWTRWLWAPLIAVVAYGACRRRFHAISWLFPAGALGTLGLLLLQSESVMEARYREPLDAILICSAWLMLNYKKNDRKAAPGIGVPRD